MGVSSLKHPYPVVLGGISCLALHPFTIPRSRMSSSQRPDASSAPVPQRRTSGSAPAWSCSFTSFLRLPMRKPLFVSNFIPLPSAVGDSAGLEVSLPSKMLLDVAASRSFPPLTGLLSYLSPAMWLPGSVRGLLAWGANRPVRRDPQFRREDQHPGANSMPRDSSAGTRTVPSGGIRV